MINGMLMNMKDSDASQNPFSFHREPTDRAPRVLNFSQSLERHGKTYTNVAQHFLSVATPTSTFIFAPREAGGSGGRVGDSHTIMSMNH
jgi:hypothetical protein